MKNDLFKIVQTGLSYVYTAKREKLGKDVIEMKRLAESSSPVSDLAEFWLGLYGGYQVLNEATATNEFKTRNGLKDLEDLWRE